MKKIIITLVIILIVSLGITPFFLTQNANSALSVGTSIISALASIVTLLIALLLYSKYGVEKSLISKQTEVVFRLLTELKKTRFLILWGNGNLLQLFLDMLGHEFINEYENKNLVFNMSYAEGLNNIWEIAEDIFLPTEIADKIRPLMVQSISGEKEKDKYMLVTVPGHSDKTKDDFFGKLNHKDMTMKEFVDQWTLVIKESKKWLKEYSNMKVDLNFERS
jgi:hypothetical protein